MLDIIDEKDMEKNSRFEGRVCCICHSTETNIDKRDNKPVWIRYKKDKDGKYNKYGHWNRKSFICFLCYKKILNGSNIYSSYNIRKSVTECRTHNILIKEFENFSDNELGLIGEEITCITLGVKNINIDTDNFKSKIDTDIHHIYGFIQSKIRTLAVFEMKWYCSIGRSREFDTLIVLCMDEYQPWKNVERVYAIPIQIIRNQVSITITKNPSRGGLKWEKFRIDEKPFNDTYHNMEIYKRWMKKYYDMS